MVIAPADRKLLRRGAGRLVDSLLRAEIQVPYRSSLRGSNMPMCERDLALTLLSERFGFQPTKSLSFSSDFFMSVGSTTHGVVQRWINRVPPANHNALWGNWCCRKCTTKMVKMTNESRCPKCKSEMEYRELEFKLGDFTGHMDGLIQLVPGRKLFLILEIKTTSTADLVNLPYPSYVAQATSYRDSLREQYDIETVGILFLFIPRDSLWAMKPVIYFDGDLEEGLLEDYQLRYKKVVAAVRKQKVSRLERLCESREEADASFKKCPWRVVCFADFPLDSFVRHRCVRKRRKR